MTTEYITLPAFRITRNDGSSYVISMAAGITLKDAQEYFIGKIFTEEDQNDGTETNWTAVKVEEVQP